MTYLQLIFWLALLVVLSVFLVKWSGGAGALTLSYFLTLSLIHVPGMLAHLDPNMVGSAQSILGFTVTLAGLAAWFGGVIVARLLNRRGFIVTGDRRPPSALWLYTISRRFLIIGGCVFFLVLPLAAFAKSLSSILSGLGGLLIVGIWLRLYAAVVSSDRGRVVSTVALLPLLPLGTLATGGFIGYGTYWLLSALCFLFVVSRQRIWFFVSAPVVVYLGLSLFVTYMGERTAIRDVVWQERASLSDRLDRMSNIVTNFQLLDLDDPKHLDALDVRLNQNFFVGTAVGRHEDGMVDLALGATVPWWALIPRAIWPGKPETGGGGTVVSDFTGIMFAEGTSVGAGQVLEFYINFGWLGVMVGFFGWGFLLMFLDLGIMRAIAAGDMRGLLVRALPGMPFLSAGGNLLEIFVGAIAAYLAALLVVRLDTRLNPPLPPTTVGARSRVAAR